MRACCVAVVLLCIGCQPVGPTDGSEEGLYPSTGDLFQNVNIPVCFENVSKVAAQAESIFYNKSSITDL